MPEKNSIEEKQEENNNSSVPRQRVIVMGASAGGFEAFKTVIKGLPADFPIPIFIVWHMSPDIRGILPQVLNKENDIFAAHAYDNEAIRPNRIYVAPPDHHLLIEEGRVKITKGPKENRFRPAVDPLFRSAAYTYGNHVIGIILSGALDDGTAGLWRIKHNGGIAIVQNPLDAEMSSMPANALRGVAVDYCVPVSAIAGLLVKLSNEVVTENPKVMKDEKTKIEIDIAAEHNAFQTGSLQIGDLSPFACPECHGVLSRIREGGLSRYRCHTGHAYSADALLLAVTEKIEDSLYGALRGMDESILLLNHIGDHYAEADQPKLAALYFKKAADAQERSDIIRRTLSKHEPLSRDKLLYQSESDSAR
ncbi:MAG: chemotaxis protein CheB [Chitinophagaceae bacterium]|nr:MAG: chemotaxis protein CheB [Chitinophagaceae bacterium]